jgi:hypothetical protein
MSDIGSNDKRPANGLLGQASNTLGKASETFQNKTSEGVEAVRAKASEGVEAVKATVDDISERTGQAYTRGNVAVTRAVDPIPSLLLAGAIGFLAGYVCSELGRH